MTDWMNAWTNEWMNEWTNEWLVDWLNECMKVWHTAWNQNLIYFHSPKALLLGTFATYFIVFNIFITQEASLKPKTKHHPENNITLLWYVSTKRLINSWQRSGGSCISNSGANTYVKQPFTLAKWLKSPVSWKSV